METDKDPNAFYIGSEYRGAHTRNMLRALELNGKVTIHTIGARATLAAWQAMQTIVYAMCSASKHRATVEIEYAPWDTPNGPANRFTAIIYKSKGG